MHWVCKHAALRERQTLSTVTGFARSRSANAHGRASINLTGHVASLDFRTPTGRIEGFRSRHAEAPEV